MCPCVIKNSHAYLRGEGRTVTEKRREKREKLFRRRKIGCFRPSASPLCAAVPSNARGQTCKRVGQLAAQRELRFMRKGWRKRERSGKMRGGRRRRVCNPHLDPIFLEILQLSKCDLAPLSFRHLSVSLYLIYLSFTSQRSSIVSN